ncbi:MAG TPA: DUF882 domain-containing protein [Polyangiaceae bacterium]|nr:DUF882 domain-containing protein [Polyangiaceae bacterium]
MPDPAAVAYLSGNQALVGPHARSDQPVARDPAGRPMLALRTINHGESLAIPSSSDEGEFSAIDLDRAARLLRAAGGEEHPVDPRVLGLVYRIQTHFRVPEIRVVSGYRVPKPASRSNHGRGRAVDLIVPGIVDEDVAAFVRELGFVGVGIYPSSQFVHVDVRPRSYFWVDFSRPHARNREHAILGDLAMKSDAAALDGGKLPIEPFGIVNDVEGALRTYGVPPGSPVANDDEEEDR